MTLIFVTFLWQTDLATRSMCVVTSPISTRSVKMDEHKLDEHEEIKKKEDILNGILAKTRNPIFKGKSNLVFLSINQVLQNTSPI